MRGQKINNEATWKAEITKYFENKSTQLNKNVIYKLFSHWERSVLCEIEYFDK